MMQTSAAKYLNQLNSDQDNHMLLHIRWSSFALTPKPRHVSSISGLVVEYIVAIDVTRARFPADAFDVLLFRIHFCIHGAMIQMRKGNPTMHDSKPQKLSKSTALWHGKILVFHKTIAASHDFQKWQFFCCLCRNQKCSKKMSKVAKVIGINLHGIFEKSSKMLLISYNRMETVIFYVGRP